MVFNSNLFSQGFTYISPHFRGDVQRIHGLVYVQPQIDHQISYRFYGITSFDGFGHGLGYGFGYGVGYRFGYRFGYSFSYFIGYPCGYSFRYSIHNSFTQVAHGVQLLSLFFCQMNVVFLFQYFISFIAGHIFFPEQQLQQSYETVSDFLVAQVNHDYVQQVVGFLIGFVPVKEMLFSGSSSRDLTYSFEIR